MHQHSRQYTRHLDDPNRDLCDYQPYSVANKDQIHCEAISITIVFNYIVSCHPWLGLPSVWRYCEI